MNSILGAAVIAAVLAAAPDERTKAILNDRESVEGDGYWIYNDLPRAIAQARDEGKPLVVVLRCVPCAACAQLDADIVRRDPVVQSLLDQFVCVRIINTNGLDLSLFQYDYDQSFAAFFLNADQTIYGRYGTRSHETESARDVSVEGFARALEGALELHRDYRKNRAALADKRGPAPVVKTPEQFASLKERYGPRLAAEGNVAASCIHCHQVGEALRREYRDHGEAMPERVLFPYPLPNVLGLTLDPKQKARVAEVADGSSAHDDGFRVDDDLVSLEGQPLLSIADVQWVLHQAPESGRLQSVVRRGGKELRLPLTLPSGWRRRGNLSWRATSWDLRRMVLGGLVLTGVSADERQRADLPDDTPALRVKYVGEYGDHGVGKKAEFHKGDIVVEVAGERVPPTESQLLAKLIDNTRPGQRIKMVVLRDGQRLTLEMPMQ